MELRSNDDVASIWSKSGNNGSALIADISRSPGDKTAENNAVLIQAAPEMLEVLIEAVEYLDPNPLNAISSTSVLHNKMREVILKAIGQKEGGAQ